MRSFLIYSEAMHEPVPRGRPEGRHAAEPAPAVPPGDDVHAAPSRPRVLDSHALFAGAREIIIRHQESSYRLRMTALGKLILTK